MKRIKTLYQGAYILLEESDNKQAGIVLGSSIGQGKGIRKRGTKDICDFRRKVSEKVTAEQRLK